MANKTLTDTATWQTAQSTVNGDPDDQTLDEACHQAAANRSAYLKEVVEGSTDGVGVRRIRTVATEVLLMALTGMVEDDVALVRGLGLYVFGSSAPVSDQPFVFAADDSSGYWCWIGMFGLEDQLGNALVITDYATDKLKRPDVVPNRMVFDQVATNTGTGTITSVDSAAGFASYADTGVTITLNGLEQGDIVHFNTTFLVEQDSVTGGKLRMVTSENSGTKTLVDGTEQSVAGSARVPCALTGRHVMGANGSLTLTLQGVASSGSYSVMASSTILATVFRP